MPLMCPQPASILPYQRCSRCDLISLWEQFISVLFWAELQIIYSMYTYCTQEKAQHAARDWVHICVAVSHMPLIMFYVAFLRTWKKPQILPDVGIILNQYKCIHWHYDVWFDWLLADLQTCFILLWLIAAELSSNKYVFIHLQARSPCPRTCWYQKRL